MCSLKKIKDFCYNKCDECLFLNKQQGKAIMICYIFNSKKRHRFLWGWS